MGQKKEVDEALREIDRKFNKIVAERDGLRAAQTCIDCKGLICPPMRCKVCLERAYGAKLNEADELLRRALTALELRAIGDPNHQAALSDLHQRIVRYAP